MGRVKKEGAETGGYQKLAKRMNEEKEFERTT